MSKAWDVVIIGTGAGGGTLAYALRDTGFNILMLERGDFLRKEPENWQAKAVFQENRYKSTEPWRIGKKRKPIRPFEYYFVGGKTKLYGAALMRFREIDFKKYEFADGVSPEWPVSYEEFEPWYSAAEKLYRVHGDNSADPTGPQRSENYPYEPVPWDPYINEIADGLSAQGVRPFPIPIGIDFQKGAGTCVPCTTCDGYPCFVQAKSDAESRCVRPALEHPNVHIRTKTLALKLLASKKDHVDGVLVQNADGTKEEINAKLVVVACGAVPSAALLLRSQLANSSGLVGRNLMFHIHTGLVGLHPLRKNSTAFQKAIAVTEFCDPTTSQSLAAGSLQFLGHYPFEYLGLGKLGRFVTNRSYQLSVMSEDLPNPENRVAVSEKHGEIEVHYRPNNMKPHRHLVKKARRMFRKAGTPVIITKHVPMPQHAGAHACGSLRFGKDPKTSVLDTYCKAHDIDNLYVVDSSFFPSSGTVNPALTIMAQALRVGQHLRERLAN